MKIAIEVDTKKNIMCVTGDGDGFGFPATVANEAAYAKLADFVATCGASGPEHLLRLKSKSIGANPTDEVKDSASVSRARADIMEFLSSQRQRRPAGSASAA